MSLTELSELIDGWEQTDDAPPVAEVAPEFSEDAIALEFAAAHAGSLRYVDEMKRWLVWDGKCWNFDKTLVAWNKAREVCRRMAAECNDPRVAKRLASDSSVNAVTHLARSDRRLVATVDQWDADPWLSNTPAGIVDLKSGAIRAHDPLAYMTKITGVAPDPNCPTPVWTGFLDRIMGGNAEMVAYLQRVAGYSLTGSTQEHALFFLYGLGANGKSTFLNALIACAGDYHKTAPIETFTASNQERHPTDLAGLRGARMVTSVETEEGRRWAESKIKALTGGDRIAARFMRQDFFEFAPQFKLVIAGNHKPGLRTVDEAIRRRFNLIPFTVTIPPEQRDLTLGEKLKAEYPGILAWMIDGCKAWLKHGLAPPKIVTDATAEYLEAEDAINAWIEDCCERGPNAFTKSAELFVSWVQWADKAGEPKGTQRALTQKLIDRGFEAHRDRNLGRGIRGLRCLDGF